MVSDLTIGLADKNNRVRFTSCVQSKYSTCIEIVENESNRIFEDIAPVCHFRHLFARSAQTAESFKMKWDVRVFLLHHRNSAAIPFVSVL
jgi:hypothetical protein